MKILVALSLASLGFTQIGVTAEPPITALAFDPTETKLIAGSQAGVKCYGWPNLKPGKTIATELKQVHDLAFSPDGKTLAIAGGTPGEEGTVELWNWPKIDESRSYSVHSDVIYQIVWSADSASLFTASHDATIAQLAGKTGKVLQEFSGHSQPVISISLLAQDKVLVSAGSDQTIRVWDTATGELLRSFNNHTAAVRDLAVRPSGDSEALPMVASIARDKTLRLWQPTIGRMVRFKRFSSEPLAVTWSRDGESLFLTEDDGNLVEVDPDTLEIKTTRKTSVDRPISLQLSKDGKTAVTGGSGGVIRVVKLK
jgi:WD40 repeat protein